MQVIMIKWWIIKSLKILLFLYKFTGNQSMICTLLHPCVIGTLFQQPSKLLQAYRRSHLEPPEASQRSIILNYILGYLRGLPLISPEWVCCHNTRDHRWACCVYQCFTKKTMNKKALRRCDKCYANKRKLIGTLSVCMSVGDPVSGA